MINPRTINISCNVSTPTGQEACYNNALTNLYANKTANSAELPALYAAVEQQNLNLTNCSQYASCYNGTDWARYKSLQTTAINNLNTAKAYISDADTLISSVNGSLNSLINSKAYKDAIASGAIPATPIDVNKQIATKTTLETIKSYLTPRNVGIAVGAILLIILIVVAVKRNNKSKSKSEE